MNHPSLNPGEIPNPLLNVHQQAGAEFQSYGALEIVQTFGQPQAEYSAIRKGAALMDLPYRGLLEVTGRDRLPFLNNLLTNQTYDKASRTGLLPGTGVYAFHLNAKGRIVADVHVLERGDRTLLELDARLVSALIAQFEKYRFVEQVKFRSLAGALHQVALHGPAAGSLLNLTSPPLGPLESREIDLFGVQATVWRDDPAGVPGFFLILPADQVEAVWSGLISRFAGDGVDLGKRPLRPVGWAAFNATRIEAGRPLFGVDFDDSVLPAETGVFNRAVSVTKGCYMGQEIVARMHARSQAARCIAGIRMTDEALPMAGAPIYDEQGNQVGGVTSSTISPVLSNAAIGLGFLKKPFFSPGTAIRIPAEGEIRPAQVVELPFLR